MTPCTVPDAICERLEVLLELVPLVQGLVWLMALVSLIVTFGLAVLVARSLFT